ncbi:MAG: hypothetical protein FJX46_16380, partial [Alphaproteobacteria bacterium]|nr:hypothetical protein [Alphaproteobacteria bacterium]
MIRILATAWLALLALAACTPAPVFDAGPAPARSPGARPVAESRPVAAPVQVGQRFVYRLTGPDRRNYEIAFALDPRALETARNEMPRWDSPAIKAKLKAAAEQRQTADNARFRAQQREAGARTIQAIARDVRPQIEVEYRPQGEWFSWGVRPGPGATQDAIDRTAVRVKSAVDAALAETVGREKPRIARDFTTFYEDAARRIYAEHFYVYERQGQGR